MNCRLYNVVFLLIVSISTIDKVNLDVVKPKDMCKETNQLIGYDDKFTFVQVSVNETLILECHFCSENDTDEPKTWYKINSENITEEVQFGMENDAVLNRISLSINHSLVFREVFLDDLGIYYCKVSNDEDDEDIVFYFALDVTFNNVDTVRGNVVDFMKYEADYLRPINKLFKSPEFLNLGSFSKLEVVAEWDPWDACDVCGRPPGLAFQESIGYCRILLRKKDDNIPTNGVNNVKNEKLQFLIKVGQISCRSFLLKEVLPTVYEVTRDLPDFIQFQKCKGECVIEHQGLGWNSSSGYKYRKLLTLTEKSHLTIVCPESTMESAVVWRRNGKIIEPGKYFINNNNSSESRIMADTYGTLYLSEVTLSEEGNYTCQVDGVKMQQIKIIVLSNYTIITQVLLRHMIYLGFVLSLTSLCYCSGLFLAWRRRHKFKTYEDILAEEAENRPYYYKTVDENEKTKTISTDTVEEPNAIETNKTETIDNSEIVKSPLSSETEEDDILPKKKSKKKQKTIRSIMKTKKSKTTDTSEEKPLLFDNENESENKAYKDSYLIFKEKLRNQTGNGKMKKENGKNSKSSDSENQDMLQKLQRSVDIKNLVGITSTTSTSSSNQHRYIPFLNPAKTFESDGNKTGTETSVEERGLLKK